MSLATWKPRKRKAKAVKPAAKPPKKRGPKPKIASGSEDFFTEIYRQRANNPDYLALTAQELKDNKISLANTAAVEADILKGKPPSITKKLWHAQVLGDGPDHADAHLPDPVSPKLRKRVAANERRAIRNGKKLSAQLNRDMKRIRGARQAGGVSQKKKWEIYARELMEKNRGLMVLPKDSTVARKIRDEWEKIPKGKLQGEPEHLKERGIKGIDVPSVRTITSWSKEFREKQRNL